MGETRKLRRMVNEILSCAAFGSPAAFFTKKVYEPGGRLVYRA